MALEISDNQILTLYRHYAEALKGLYDENEAKALARLVFQEIIGISPARLFADPTQLLTESEILNVHFAFKDLLKGKPIQYLIGKAYFRGLELHVEPGVLIPRPETEELVGLVIEDFRNSEGIRILDIGTGSGCIAISLARELKNPVVYALDNHDTALAIASQNAQKHNVRIDFQKNNILDPTGWDDLPRQLDVVISNPPYITESEKHGLHRNVTGYEPPEALFVPDDEPLIFYKAITSTAHSILKSGGRLYYEINEKLGKEIAHLLKETGFCNVSVINDFRGKDRFVVAHRP